MEFDLKGDLDLHSQTYQSPGRTKAIRISTASLPFQFVTAIAVTAAPETTEKWFVEACRKDPKLQMCQSKAPESVPTYSNTDMIAGLGALTVIVIGVLWVISIARSMLRRSNARLPQTQLFGVDTNESDRGTSYVEIQEPRSGWGLFWKWMLILWIAAFIWHDVGMIIRADEVSRQGGALARVLLENRLSNVLLTDFVLFVLGCAALGWATYATRGHKRLVRE